MSLSKSQLFLSPYFSRSMAFTLTSQPKTFMNPILCAYCISVCVLWNFVIATANFVSLSLKFSPIAFSCHIFLFDSFITSCLQCVTHCYAGMYIFLTCNKLHAQFYGAAKFDLLVVTMDISGCLFRAPACSHGVKLYSKGIYGQTNCGIKCDWTQGNCITMFLFKYK